MVQKKSTANDLVEMSARFPWWVGIIFAALSFILLHWWGAETTDQVSQSAAPAENIYSAILHVTAFIGQYLLPFIFVSGALASAIKRSQRKKLYNGALKSRSSEYFEKISWFEFVQLTAEFLRKRGYRILLVCRGAAGGPDLILKKGKEKIVVQCKHAEISRVGAESARELLGAMADAGVSTGFLVTSGEFTRDAVACADANNIRLLEGKRLLEQLQGQAAASRSGDAKNGRNNSPVLWGSGVIIIAVLSGIFLPSNFERSLLKLPRHLFSNQTQEKVEPGTIEEKGEVSPGISIEERDYTFTDSQVNEAIREVLAQKQKEQKKSKHSDGLSGELSEVLQGYTYEIELYSGGWIYCDDIEVSDSAVSYTGKQGVIVSVNREEIKSIKRSRVDK